MARESRFAVTNRLMGDAIHDNAHALSTMRLELVAGYVTGSPDIRWTPEDWALFPHIPHVTIDQGFTGSPVPSAIVRDVEAGAWTPGNAVHAGPWTPERPTIYSAQNTLQAILDDGWRRDLWVALPGWNPGDPWPPIVAEAVHLGCTIIAVQNRLDVAGVIDLSQVLDPYWPGSAPDPQPPAEDYMQFLTIPGSWITADTFVDAHGTEWVVGLGRDQLMYYTKRPAGGKWTAPAVLP